MKKDCCCCVQWDPANECCTADELYENDYDLFVEVCPKLYGDPEYQDDYDE